MLSGSPLLSALRKLELTCDQNFVFSVTHKTKKMNYVTELQANKSIIPKVALQYSER